MGFTEKPEARIVCADVPGGIGIIIDAWYLVTSYHPRYLGKCNGRHHKACIMRVYEGLAYPAKNEHPPPFHPHSHVCLLAQFCVACIDPSEMKWQLLSTTYYPSNQFTRHPSPNSITLHLNHHSPALPMCRTYHQLRKPAGSPSPPPLHRERPLTRTGRSASARGAARPGG